MREKKNYRIITFHTTSAAMAMEKYCVEDLAAPEDCDRVYQSMNAILLGKGKQSFEYRALRADVKDYFIGEIRVGMNPNGVFPAFKHS